MTSQTKLLNNIEKIEQKETSDLIIQQIQNLLKNGDLKQGDRLPSERALTENFGVGRGQVRKALKKLEFYGILETLPQSGTVVASLEIKALEGLISNVLQLHEEDFKSLLETRSILEIQAARLAAERATDEEIKDIRKAHHDFLERVENSESGLDEDLLFHLRVAKYSQNSVLHSLIALITPDILRMSNTRNTCTGGRNREALKEHEKIISAIADHDPDHAEAAMQYHQDQTLEIVQEK